MALLYGTSTGSEKFLISILLVAPPSGQFIYYTISLFLLHLEKATVRIPILNQGEVKKFGVYGVPGVKNHVFVGPFTKSEE